MRRIRSFLERKKMIISYSGMLILLTVSADLLAHFIPSIRYYCTSETMGVVLQISTAIVCCTVSVIGISFSIQDSLFFGVKIKEMRELDASNRYSLQDIMAISVVIVFLNLAFFIIGKNCAMCGLTVAALIFCLQVIICEVPLMTKSEEAGLQILRSYFEKGLNPSGIYSIVFDQALKFLILHKNLNITYQKLKGDTNQKKDCARLLQKLLDIQIAIASELDLIENRKERLEAIDALKDNITFFFNSAFDPDRLPADDSGTYIHFIKRTLFYLEQSSDGKESVKEIIFHLLYMLDYIDQDDKVNVKRDSLFSVLIFTITCSVPKGDFALLDAVQEYYAEADYRLQENYNSTLLFSLLSLYFYYLCKEETIVPETIKEAVKRKICSRDKIVEGNRVIYEWSFLFQRFSGHNSVDYSSFMRVFKMNENSMNYMLFNDGFQWSVLNEELAFQWYAANLLNCYENCFNDFGLIFGVEPDDHLLYNLKQLYNDCFKEGNQCNLPDYMYSMLSFFNVKRIAHLFNVIESNDHPLFNYLTSIKTWEIQKETVQLREMNEKELAVNIKAAVSAAVEKQWGLDDTLDLEPDKKTLKAVIEKDNAINFDRFWIDRFVRGVFSSIRGMIPLQTIVIDEHFDESIKALLDMPLSATSAYRVDSIPFYIDDEGLKQRFNKEINLLDKYNSSILPQASFVLKDGFSFNYKVESVKVEELTEEQINERVELYKREDGQYVYHGTFMTREDVYSTVASRAFSVTLSARYALCAPKGGVIAVTFGQKQ